MTLNRLVDNLHPQIPQSGSESSLEYPVVTALCGGHGSPPVTAIPI